MLAASSLKYENQLWTAVNVPIRPAATKSSAATHVGWWRYMNASIRWRPVSRATSTMPWASSAVMASGFSHRTCLPARSAAIVHSAWRWLGSGMYTASTSGSARSASYEPWAVGIPSRSALVAGTGLKGGATRGLIGELVAGRLVFEGPGGLDGPPGRPSPLVRAD